MSTVCLHIQHYSIASRISDNPYINGLDFDLQGKLHITWYVHKLSVPVKHLIEMISRTYRDFINDTGKDVAVQAGPNGPENVSRDPTSKHSHLAKSHCSHSSNYPEPRPKLRILARRRVYVEEHLGPGRRQCPRHDKTCGWGEQ